MMHPRTSEILEHLDAQHVAMQRSIDDVPAQLRERRPEEGRWSVAEVIEHLAIVEQRIAKLIAREVASARDKGLGVERETSPVSSMLPLERVIDRRRRVVAGDAAQPRGELDAATAWLKFEDARRAIREGLLAADGLALAEVSAPHPALGSLNLYQWFLFVAGHEARHALQVREIGAQLARRS